MLLSIDAVMAAMANYAEAQADEASAKASYTGYSWDYYGQRYIDAVASAKEAAEKILRDYIAQEIKESSSRENKYIVIHGFPGGKVEYPIVTEHDPYRLIPEYRQPPTKEQEEWLKKVGIDNYDYFTHSIRVKTLEFKNID